MAQLAELYVDITARTGGLDAALRGAQLRVASAANNMQRSMSGALGDSLADFAKRLNTQIDNAVGAFNRSYGTLVNTVRDSLSQMGGILTATITAPAVFAGMSGWQNYLDLDSLKRGLVAVSGSAEEAERQLIKLREIAKLPGLGLREAIEGAINLQAAGMSADMAQRTLKAFGNALATVGKGKTELEWVNYAITQIMTMGKVAGQEIRQLQQHVPQIRKIMMEAFGTADTEKLAEMGITSEQFLEAVVAELEKLPPVTSGARNAIENLSDAWTEMSATMVEEFAPAIEKVLGYITDAIKWFGRLPGWAKRMIVVFAAFAAAVGPILLALGALAGAITSIIALCALLGPALGAVLVAFGGLALAATILGTLAVLLWRVWKNAQKTSDAVRDVGNNAEKSSKKLREMSDEAERATAVENYRQATEAANEEEQKASELRARLQELNLEYEKMRQQFETMKPTITGNEVVAARELEEKYKQIMKVQSYLWNVENQVAARRHHQYLAGERLRALDAEIEASRKSGLVTRLTDEQLKEHAENILKLAEARRRDAQAEIERRRAEIRTLHITDLYRQAAIAGAREQFGPKIEAGKTIEKPFTRNELLEAIKMYTQEQRIANSRDKMIEQVVALLKQINLGIQTTKGSYYGGAHGY